MAHAPTEATNLSGSWVLDRNRSELMQPFLQIMGVAPLAIEAQLKCETDAENRNVISLEGDRLAIHKRTKINVLTEHYDLGVPKDLPAIRGVRRTTVDLRVEGDYSGMQAVTEMPTPNGELYLLETRQLADKGKTLLQVR